MSRALNLLTARAVATLKEPGRHADGGGLYLRVTSTGSRSWVFMTTRAGKRSEIGLGAATAVSLAAARGLAAKMREAVSTGVDPRSILQPAMPKAMVPITFGEFADTYITSIEDGWKNEVHRQQWRQSLRDHAKALTPKPIVDIDTDDVLEVLQPIWITKAETAKRLRGRIERILDAAKARGLRSRESMNPALYRGHLALLLPKQSKEERGHHAALPWKELPSFMGALRQREALAARCLEFVILTACRSGEALGATWDEIDLKEKVWRIPKERMKAGVEHAVPLSVAALELLSAIAQDKVSSSNAIFSIRGAQRSNMAMAMLLRRMGHADITTHGFRSTFRDWAGDATNYPRELIEQALAHSIQSKAERAYRRGTALEKRRELMEDWATFNKGGIELQVVLHQNS